MSQACYPPCCWCQAHRHSKSIVCFVINVTSLRQLIMINCHSILCNYLPWEKTKQGINVIFYISCWQIISALPPPFCSHIHRLRPHLASFWSYLIICLPPIIVMHLTIPENNQVLEWTLDKCRKVISLLLQMRSIFTPTLLLRHWYEIMALYYVKWILTDILASRQDRRVLQKRKIIRIKFLSIWGMLQTSGYV